VWNYMANEISNCCLQLGFLNMILYAGIVWFYQWYLFCANHVDKCILMGIYLLLIMLVYILKLFVLENVLM
jgi:hypothetical protein